MLNCAPSRSVTLYEVKDSGKNVDTQQCDHYDSPVENASWASKVALGVFSCLPFPIAVMSYKDKATMNIVQVTAIWPSG